MQKCLAASPLTVSGPIRWMDRWTKNWRGLTKMTATKAAGGFRCMLTAMHRNPLLPSHPPGLPCSVHALPLPQLSMRHLHPSTYGCGSRVRIFRLMSFENMRNPGCKKTYSTSRRGNLQTEGTRRGRSWRNWPTKQMGTGLSVN